MKTIKVGSDFSGVGAFDFAINRVAEEKGFKVENVFACDWDKYARKSYLANHKEPGYYPHDVYERDFPEESLDIYMTSPPCQGFSMAGVRKSKDDDKRNILFFNSLEFIQKNNPRHFIFENVRGLMSHENGNTFQEWINLLGGKSVNGLPVLFPYDESVPYHIYHKVLNSKKYGIPQNRERVFIIGIRDDVDNNFRFPKEQPLKIKLKDILEGSVDNKYFLSNKLIKYFIENTKKNIEKGNGFKFDPKSIDDIFESKTLTTREGSQMDDNFIFESKYKNEIKTSIGQSYSTCIDASYFKGFGVRKGKCRQVVNDCYKIRRLTPRECFRLQGFKDDFQFVVSDTQLYKQAGNSITIDVLEKIFNNLTF